MGMRNLIFTYGISLALFYATNAYTGNTYTNEEIRALREFKPMVQGGLTDSYMNSDSWLITWLRANNLNVKEAISMLQKSLEWRKSNKISQLLNEDFTKLHKVFPYILDAEDHEGRPVVELPLGQWDVRKAVLSGERGNLNRYLYQLLERGAKRIRDAASVKGSNITQLILIMDINGYNVRQHGCISCFPLYIDFITSYERNYPQMARNITIINCPRVSESLLRLLRAIMTPATSEALKFYGYDKSEWKHILLDEISPDQLTKEFGGNRVR